MVRQVEIYALSLRGSARRRLVAGVSPTFSPDGRRIVFCGDGLFIVNATGTGKKRISRMACASAAGSPGGRTIAFSDGDEMYTVTRRGRNVRWIASGAEPAWSSRRRIAFTQPQGDDEGSISTMTADGRDLLSITHGPCDSSPGWSPDGRRLAFARGCGPPSGRAIYVVDRAGRGLRRLGRGNDPAWSPDGRQIAFSRVVGDFGEEFDLLYSDLLVMDADGGGRRQVAIATSVGADTRRRRGPEASFDSPAWQPLPR